MDLGDDCFVAQPAFFQRRPAVHRPRALQGLWAPPGCWSLLLVLIVSFVIHIPYSRAQPWPGGITEEEDEDFLDTDPELAPFVATPMQVVQAMLDLAAVSRDDVLYDLGSGDGRIVITAARRHGARAVGFELDPDLVRKSRENIRAAGVEHLAEIRQQNIMEVRFSPATVVTMYLIQESNLLLRPLLRRELPPGARIVSHKFDMGDWEQDDDRQIVTPDGETHDIYLWRIGPEDKAAEGAE